MTTATTKTFSIRGFHCSGCADNLGRSLRRHEGVIKAEADYDRARVDVRYDPERVSEDDLRRQITLAGFEAV